MHLMPLSCNNYTPVTQQYNHQR